MSRIPGFSLGLALTCVLMVQPVDSRAAPRDDLDQARGNFEFGEVEAALDAVDLLLSNGSLSGADLLDGYLLKGQCELEVGTRQRALDAFCAAFRIQPEWTPDPDLLSEADVELLEKARVDCGPTEEIVEPSPQTVPIETPVIAEPSSGRSWYKKPWTWVGGAALAVTAVLVASGGDGGGGDSEPRDPPGVQPLDDFPAPPDP